MTKRILDLFCGAGGMSTGFRREYPNAYIVGVDIELQPHYTAGVFVQMDALEYLDGCAAVGGGGFDYIHASPPCQGYSWAAAGARNRGREWPDLVAPVRDRLIKLGIPWTIENVIGSPLIDPITLCGETFGLNVIRHRLFESSEPLTQPKHQRHLPPIWRPAMTGPPRLVKRTQYCSVAGHGGDSNSFKLRDWVDAMGWPSNMPITRQELCESIPPAYAAWLIKEVI
jgi:DNA (cytosine-5)-methyltransferase 1